MQRIQAGWQILENAKQYLPYIRTCPNYPKEYKGAYTNHVDSHGGRGVSEMSTLLIKPI